MNRQRDILDGYNLEVFDPSQNNWGAVSQDILNIENIVFGTHADPELPVFFQDPTTVAVLLRERESNKIVGYTYAFPDINDDSKIVAHVDSVALLPDYQGKGLVVALNRRLEEELFKRGYEFITLNAGLANNYAEKIAKNYADRIVESHDLVSKYGHGPQRYFKIKLFSRPVSLDG